MKDKTESCTPEGSEQTRPFFARFLEGQDTANDSFQTLKYPSDRDEIDQRLDYKSNSNAR
jgi:hypothetical protein